MIKVISTTSLAGQRYNVYLVSIPKPSKSSFRVVCNGIFENYNTVVCYVSAENVTISVKDTK